MYDRLICSAADNFVPYPPFSSTRCHRHARASVLASVPSGRGFEAGGCGSHPVGRYASGCVALEE
jgi:hypothetical protein